MVRLGDVSPTIWDEIVEKMEEKLVDRDFQEEDILIDWKKLANKRKFDRELFEKYGFLKDIILHPRFQYVKQLIEEHADFRGVVADPIMPWTTAIIVLFMMYKRVSMGVMFLVAAFIFSINPLYVTILVLLSWLFSLTNKYPKLYLPSKATSKLIKESKHYKPETLNLNDTNSDLHTYDHILIGNDLATLYTAALLARNNHKCCVLQPYDGAVVKVEPKDCPCPVYLQNLSVGRVEQYQSLLDVAQSLQPSQRVTFSPLGSESDGFTSCLLRVLYDKNHSAVGCLRAGEGSLASDLSSRFAVDKTSFSQGCSKLKASLSHLTSFLLSRTAPDPEQSAAAKTEGYKLFKDLATTSVEQLLSSWNLEDSSPAATHLLSHLPSLATFQPSTSNNSAFYVANAMQMAESGLFYPHGGYPAVEAALASTVRAAGGNVFTDIDVKELVLEEVPTANATSDHRKVRVTGVRVSSKPSGTSGAVEHSLELTSRLSVVSGVGVLNTYLKLLPAETVRDAVRKELCGLSESRPTVNVVYWLSGSKDALGLTSTDYVEVSESGPGLGKAASARVVRVWSPSAKDAHWSDNHPADLHVVVIEMDTPDAFIGPVPFQFSPSLSTADPYSSGPTVYVSKLTGGAIDACTSPDHEDYANKLNVTMHLSKSKVDKIRQITDAKLKELYPAAVGREIFVHVQPPSLGGSMLANNVAKFEANLSCVTDVEHLYLTGRDLATCGLMGDIQSGWGTANAILGYSVQDMMTNRSIVSDLRNVKRTLP